MAFPQKTEPIIKLVNRLNWTEGDPYETPNHRRADNWSAFRGGSRTS